MAEPPPRPAGSHRLLVAEDEPHIRRILTTLFEASGFELDTACDGAAALDALRGDTRYDLLLLDLIMPNVSGLKVLREQALSLGAEAFLTKPFSPKKLLNQVNALLARH